MQIFRDIQSIIKKQIIKNKKILILLFQINKKVLIYIKSKEKI